MNISIIGSGSFGTSMAIHLANNAKNIKIWGNDSDVINEINTNRTNLRYLKDTYNIPENIYASIDIEEVLEGTKYIILAVPSNAIKSISKKINPYLSQNHIIINLAKGLDESSFKRLSQVIEEETNSNKVVVLSGPSHAEEIVNNIPTTIVASSRDISLAEEVQSDLSTKTLRIYTNPDIIGVEIGGASKNIIALAAGVLDGLGYGDNAKAALMVRGLHEITKIGLALGAEPLTLSGLSGVGDLIVTCTSIHSRNRQAGILLAKGNSLDNVLESVGMVVEGVKSCECFYKLSKEMNIELPITTSLYNILFNNSAPKDEISNLLKRDKKSEF